MKRTTLDKLVSAVGFTVAAVLIAAGAMLTWANHFVTTQVQGQVAAEKVFLAWKGSPAIAGPEFTQMQQYAGQQLTTGAQAKTYADHFIAVHLKEIGGGQTYAQLSSQALANPNDQKLAATVNTMFKGETLRGLLLNAYAFGTMGKIAGYAAIVSFVAAAGLIFLSVLGIWHSRRAKEETIALPQQGTANPVTVS